MAEVQIRHRNDVNRLLGGKRFQIPFLDSSVETRVLDLLRFRLHSREKKFRRIHPSHRT